MTDWQRRGKVRSTRFVEEGFIRSSFPCLAAVDPLCHGDAHVRAMAHRLLCGVLHEDIPFDPPGDEHTRTQQIACIREHLHQRQAA